MGVATLRSALGAGEVGAQLVGVLPDDVGGLVALDAPALGERTDVDGVEAELVVERGDVRDGIRVVARGRERSTVGGAGGEPPALMSAAGMWLNAFTTFDSAKCRWAISEVVVRFSSSSAMRPSRSQ